MLKKIMKLVVSMIKKKENRRKAEILLCEIFEGKPPLPYPDFLLEGAVHLKRLKETGKFSLKYFNNEWVCCFDKLKFNINSKEEMLIINEIFVEGIYNLEIKRPFTFVDIGMNVGITSLFFADKSLCKKVIAFEPFRPTLSLAKKNFAHNEVAQKIKLNETGLGYPSRTIEIDYSEKYKGSVGINGVGSHIGTVNDIQKIPLKIIDVYEALNNIIDDTIILKIDCEGAEYEILERLSSTRLLTRFSVLMIEWHHKGPALLKTILLDNGFDILSFSEHRLDIGMLYAFRKMTEKV